MNYLKLEDCEADEINFDWIMRFFDAVGNISNEDLQLLWGKVLANEIEKPKSCSLRTLDMIRNMSSEEARTFSVLCRYVMLSGNTYYLDSAGFFCEEDGHQDCRNYIKHKGLSYEEHIIPLLEAGALSQDHDLAMYMNKNIKLEIHNDEICGLIMNFEEDSFCNNYCEANVRVSIGIKENTDMKNRQKFSIFISSTYEDLKEERQA